MGPRRTKAKPDQEVIAAPAEKEGAQSAAASHYLVVARRYRPQTFGDLVGQEHVASALSNAIRHGRVGHAYLFTGARGVGKTSTARIFAKALNCQQGPAPEPCNRCEICMSISNGEDVDVLEIDGASNRGIEEIRQLRQSIAVRPSRSRYKIYIIDEVHMLTKEAFNALLKTLEEPPEHVKFIFCTTEPNKVPITILSRCQRFDFAGIRTTEIVDRLRTIAESEHVAVEDGVLDLVARKAAGSMRDAQSLLEQLLSFAADRLTLDDANRLLGLAGTDAIEAMAASLMARDAAAALTELHRLLDAGADAAILMEQLLAFYRDCLVATLGCKADVLLTLGAGQLDRASELGRSTGLHRLMASMQVLDHALARMRLVTHDRIIAELALVRLAMLDEMEDLQQILAELRSRPGRSIAPPTSTSPASAGHRHGESLSGVLSRVEPSLPKIASAPRSENESSLAAALSKETRPTFVPAAGDTSRPSRPAPPASHKTVEGGQPSAETAGIAEAPHIPQTPQPIVRQGPAENPLELWTNAVESLPVMLAEQARQFDRVAWAEGGRLTVFFRPQAEFSLNFCNRPENRTRIEAALRRSAGTHVAVEFVPAPTSSPQAKRTSGPVGHQQLFDIVQNPLVRKAIDVFGAEPTQILPPATRRPEQMPFSEEESFPSDTAGPEDD